uniref:Multivesicular body subunit 12A n=1 Tax=Cacopsylla melanoneura TaxID=428564 RepID=A0A8D9EID4_9HEMI
MDRRVYQSVIPDDKPITAISVLEDVQKCPSSYTVISKTLDQDSDADMWRESAFLFRKTRYLCVSKTEGIPDYIVENICIINEKETPPDGYCLIARTIDSDQRAWRKRQICYRLTKRSLAKSCISHISFQAKSKKPLEGYCSAGDLNGLTLCYKQGANVNETPSDHLYPLTPSRNSIIGPTSPYENIPPATRKQRAPSPPNYQQVEDLKPSRPAPRPPPSNYATIGPDDGLHGVPFVLNPLINNSLDNVVKSVPKMPVKTAEEIDQEFSYDFTLEKSLTQLED